MVLKLGRFTQEEEDTVKMIQSTFGKEAAKYSLVLFTHGDKLKKQTTENFISKNLWLQELIEGVYGRYHVFNNEVEDPEQIRQLLEKINRMTVENCGGHYTVNMLKKAKKASKKEKQTCKGTKGWRATEKEQPKGWSQKRNEFNRTVSEACNMSVAIRNSNFIEAKNYCLV